MRVLSDELHVSFLALEHDIVQNESAEISAAPGPTPLRLQDRGQVMASGDARVAATVFFLHDENHYNLLVPVGETDVNATHKWDQGAKVLYFRVYEMLKDHACGWTGMALALNAAKVQKPEAFKEPQDRLLFLLLEILYMLHFSLSV